MKTARLLLGLACLALALAPGRVPAAAAASSPDTLPGVSADASAPAPSASPPSADRSPIAAATPHPLDPATARAEARRLVAESMAALAAGDAVPEGEPGWRPAYERGSAAAEQALALDPESATAHYALFCNLGRRAEREGLFAQASIVGRLKSLLERALELDPGYAEAWAARGQMLLRLPWWLGGSERAGVAALERAGELAPRWPRPWLLLAEHHVEDGEPEAARRAAERARTAAAAAGAREPAARAEALLRRLDEAEG